METLLKNELVRAKIRGLSAPVKKAFIENLLDLYEQETEEMIDVIEESRMELRGDFISFEDESKNLRAESRLLEERRKDDGDDRSKSRAMSSRSSDSRMSYIDEQTNSKSLKDYAKNRGKRRPPLAEQIKRSQSTDRPLAERSDTTMTTRSLPTPASLRTVEEEKDEVMKNLSSANRQNEVERQRQAELIAQRREKRLQQKKTTEEKALELLEKAVAMDKMLHERKSQQDQKLKDRVEDMKRKRAESRMSQIDPADDRKERSRNSEQKDINGSSDKPSQSDKQNSSDRKERSDRDKDRKERSDRDRRQDKAPEQKPKESKVADYDFTIY